MRQSIKALSKIFVIPFLLIGGTAFAVDKGYDAFMNIDETQFALGIGGEVGGGTLKYLKDGKVYKFKLGGLKVGSVGVSTTSATGTVYNLKSPDDFGGTYFQAEAGLTVGGGMSGSWLKNNKGVIIHLATFNEGLEVTAGAGGVTVTME